MAKKYINDYHFDDISTIMDNMSDEDAKNYHELEIADYWIDYDKSNPI